MNSIEFLYFEGCPSYQPALQNLREVVAELHIPLSIECILVESPERAEEVGFYGSPTIKVDGKDIEGKEREASYTCRVYTIDAELTGIPTKKYLRERLASFTRD